MSYQEDQFKNIANAIRTKTGKTDSIKAVNFASEISNISSGINQDYLYGTSLFSLPYIYEETSNYTTTPSYEGIIKFDSTNNYLTLSASEQVKGWMTDSWGIIKHEPTMKALIKFPINYLTSGDSTWVPAFLEYIDDHTAKITLLDTSNANIGYHSSSYNYYWLYIFPIFDYSAPYSTSLTMSTPAPSASISTDYTKVRAIERSTVRVGYGINEGVYLPSSGLASGHYKVFTYRFSKNSGVTNNTFIVDDDSYWDFYIK